MNGHTHLLGGLLAGMVAAPLLGFGHPAALIIASALAGPLADVDHPGSWYGKFVPLPGLARVKGHIEPYFRGRFGNDWLARGQVGRATPFGVMWHRGPTHSVAAAVATGVLGFLGALGAVPHMAVAIGIGVVVGYLSHLGLDALDIMGQQMLWPFNRKRVALRWPRIPVGSGGEALVAVLLAGGILLLAPRVVPMLTLPMNLQGLPPSG